MAILAWYPVSGEDKVLMLPQRMARSSICTSKCGPVAVRWVRKNDAPVGLDCHGADYRANWTDDH